MERADGRQHDQLRRHKINRYFQIHPAGSCLIEMGNTKVICAATVEERVPGFLKGTGEGWSTAEYSLLPSSTNTRSSRERGKVSGRTQEIQRLIGRSLRSVVDLKALGERTITIDCDVIQADGGTRTAAITGSFISLVEACDSIYDPAGKKPFPVKDFLAAISVGISKDGQPILDLCYEEDSAAAVDMNIIMTGEGQLVEVQGTGEERPFTRQELNTLLDLGEKGIDELISYQKDVLGNDLVWKVGRE